MQIPCLKTPCNLNFTINCNISVLPGEFTAKNSNKNDLIINAQEAVVLNKFYWFQNSV